MFCNCNFLTEMFIAAVMPLSPLWDGKSTCLSSQSAGDNVSSRTKTQNLHGDIWSFVESSTNWTLISWRRHWPDSTAPWIPRQSARRATPRPCSSLRYTKGRVGKMYACNCNKQYLKKSHMVTFTNGSQLALRHNSIFIIIDYSCKTYDWSDFATGQPPPWNVSISYNKEKHNMHIIG